MIHFFSLGVYGCACGYRELFGPTGEISEPHNDTPTPGYQFVNPVECIDKIVCNLGFFVFSLFFP